MVTLTVTQRQTGPLSYIFSLGSFNRGWLYSKKIPHIYVYIHLGSIIPQKKHTLNETHRVFGCLSLLASKVTLGQQITIDGKSQQRNGWTSRASEGRWSAVIETVERRPTTKRLCRRRIRFRWLSRFTV